jgi:hypothetical protein
MFIQLSICDTDIKSTSTINLLKFKQVIFYLTKDCIPAPKGAHGFPEKDNIPMLTIVIATYKDKISIRRHQSNEISRSSLLQKLVKYKNLSIYKMMQIEN